MRKTIAGLLAAATLLAGLPGMVAARTPPASPATICKTNPMLLGGAESFFYKLGGCASSVAHGALDTTLPFPDPTRITRAGYVHTCQLIRAVEGFPFEGFNAYPFRPAGADWTVSTVGECATVLREVHITALSAGF